MAHQLQVLFLPFLACLILTGIHVYLGIHVISRKVIFVDIALAQIAALGATVAFLLAYDPRSNEAYFFSLGFAILAAVVFALTRTKHERVPQEAVIGLTYATATAAAILLADISPHGAEHLHDLLAGSIVWVTPQQIVKTALLYSMIGVFHVVFRKRFLLISLDPEEAYARGIRVGLWDFLFYLSFGVVITSSVQIAGVLLVFCYLVAPAVFAVMFFDNLKRRLLTGWAMATVVSAVGLYFSYDRPSGPTIIVCFAVALALGASGRAIALAAYRRRAVGMAVTVAATLALVAIAVRHFHHEGQQHAHRAGAAAGGAESLGGLHDALHDPNENIRAATVARLAAKEGARSAPDLVLALRDSSPAVREAAATALLQVDARSALPSLREAMARTSEDEWVRLRLAQAVAGLGNPEGLAALQDLVRNGDVPLVRNEALVTLASLTEVSAPPDADADSPEGRALLAKVEAKLAAGRGRVRWDPARRVYGP